MGTFRLSPTAPQWDFFVLYILYLLYFLYLLCFLYLRQMYSLRYLYELCFSALSFSFVFHGTRITGHGSRVTFFTDPLFPIPPLAYYPFRVLT